MSWWDRRSRTKHCKQQKEEDEDEDDDDDDDDAYHNNHNNSNYNNSNSRNDCDDQKMWTMAMRHRLLVVVPVLVANIVSGFSPGTIGSIGNRNLSPWSSTSGSRKNSALSSSTLNDSKTTSTEAPNGRDGQKDDSNNNVSFQDRLANSGVASAAAVATAAVNAAVSMKSLDAPDVQKSYISLDRTAGAKELDEDGLPLVYDKELIEKFWARERGALNSRWSFFVGKAVPFLTKMITLFIRDGKIADKEIPDLSRQARVDLQELGPTFIKAGQMMSVRPDVLPQVSVSIGFSVIWH